MRTLEIAGKHRHMYGWRPGHPAFKAPHFAGGFGVTPESKGFYVPRKVPFMATMPPVKDQGQVGTCTMNSLCELYENERARLGLPHIPFSRLMPYAAVREKVMHVPLSEDSGATITDTMTAGRLYGVCHESTWDYSNPEERFKLEPSPAAWAEARQHLILREYSLSTIEWMKACLQIGKAIQFGTALPKSFENVGSDGVVMMPQPGEEIIGLHSMVVAGCDDDFIFDDGVIGGFEGLNSWGEGWGNAGKFMLPYDYFRKGFATDPHSIHEEQS